MGTRKRSLRCESLHKHELKRSSIVNRKLIFFCHNKTKHKRRSLVQPKNSIDHIIPTLSACIQKLFDKQEHFFDIAIMGCTESLPDTSAFNVKIKVDSRIPPISNDIPPSMEKTEIIVKEKLFSWSGDSFHIKTRSGTPFYGMQIKGKVFTFRDQMTLLDANNKPIAVCLRKFEFMKQTFKIYRLQPLYPGQKKSQRDYNGMALYTYAEIVRRPFDTIQQVIMDNEETPSFTIHRVGSLWPKRRTVKYNGTPAALIEGGTWGGIHNTYLLSINPGIDPCLIICLTAICDEMDEENKD